MSIDTSITMVDAILNGNWTIVAKILLVLAIAVTCRVIYKLKPAKFYSAVLIFITIGFCLIMLAALSSTTNISLAPHSDDLLTAGMAIMLASILAVLAIFATVSLILKWATNQSNSEDSSIPAHSVLRCLGAIPTPIITKKQQSRASTCKAKLFIKLGTMNKAEQSIASMPDGNATKIFLKGLIAFYRGNLIASNEYRDEAEKLEATPRNKIAAVETIMNKGVQYVETGNTILANEEFARALRLMKAKRVKNRNMSIILYQNYITSLARSGNVKEAYGLLKDMRSWLNPANPKNTIAVFNTELLLVREAKLGRDAISKLIAKPFQNEADFGHLNKRERIVSAGSLLRIAWASEANPFPCLDFLNEHKNELHILKPIEKHQLMFCLHDFFLHFASNDAENEYHELKTMVREYIDEEADAFLQHLSQSLPQECVYQRAQVLKDRYALATLPEKMTICDVDDAENCLRNAMELYEENGLSMQECQVIFQLADSLIRPLERKKQTPKEAREEAARHIEIAEQKLPRFMQHPGRAELLVQLSYYEGLLGDGAACIEHINEFRKSDESLDHYTMDMKRKYICACIFARLYMLTNALAALKDDPLYELTENAQQWIDSFPHQDGIGEVVLVARYMLNANVCPITTQTCTIGDSQQEFMHSWTTIGCGSICLDIDIAFPYFEASTGDARIVFYYEDHPILKGRCKPLCKTIETDGSETPAIIRAINTVGDTSNETYHTSNEIYRAALAHTPEGAISAQEIIELLNDWATPVGVSKDN